MCKVEIEDKTQVCPLCKCVLEPGNIGESTYPDVRLITRKLSLVVRIYLFVALALEVILIWVNRAHYEGIWWSAISGAGLAYLYFILRFAILNRNVGYRAKMLALAAAGILYLVLIDDVLGYRGWSVNYGLPIGIIVMDVCILVLMVVNRRNWQSYLMFQLIVIAAGLMPILLIALDIISHPFLSHLAFLTSLFLFLGTVIIGDRKARVELKRRFHVR